MKRSRVISQATTARRQHPITLPPASIRPRLTPPQKEKTVFFNIVGIYDALNSEDREPVETLEAGKAYTLVITCDDNQSTINKNIKQDGKPVTGPFSLILSYNYNMSVTTLITPAKEVMSFESIFANEHACQFTLPDNFSACNITIMLKLKTQQRLSLAPVVEYTIAVRGREQVPQPEIFTISQINRRLPERTAILLVEPATRQMEYEQQIRLRGWGETGQQLDDKVEMRTIVSIEELRVYRLEKKKQKTLPDALLARLHNFSRNNSQNLLRWLNDLFVDYQDPFNLIIVDLTDREIPWEIVELGRDQYLGVCARIVRWLPTKYFQQRRELAIAPHEHQGPVLSYLDEQLGPEIIQDERDVLQRLQGKPYASLADLKQRLTDTIEGVGLIYIGCHGARGQDLLQHNVPELSSIMLEDMHACDHPRLTVFLNACEAARTIKKSPDDVSNFVETFLAYCASGFIGPLAQIDIKTASELAGRILSSMLQPGGAQIAEQLRLLRKEELERLKQKKGTGTATRADYYRFIDIFMYVYYGNPLARLQLYAREESGA